MDWELLGNSQNLSASRPVVSKLRTAEGSSCFVQLLSHSDQKVPFLWHMVSGLTPQVAIHQSFGEFDASCGLQSTNQPLLASTAVQLTRNLHRIGVRSKNAATQLKETKRQVSSIAKMSCKCCSSGTSCSLTVHSKP